ncbi:MAG: hypothetical protein J1F03_00085 [Oscillospiraceae bacterium]|nr:hypothetical protein [Oscillospiraceae bacterium]
MNNPPERCPYCGSIENHGNLCDWCNNPISEDYIPTNNKKEDKKMKIKLEFTELDPEQAMSLIAFATGQNTGENKPSVPALQISAGEPDKPSAVSATEEKPAKRKAAKKDVTLEEVRAAMLAKVKEGKKEAVQGLIAKRDAAKLTEIDAEEYPTLLEELEAV